jgi:ornithine carbamoyltransferase
MPVRSFDCTAELEHTVLRCVHLRKHLESELETTSDFIAPPRWDSGLDDLRAAQARLADLEAQIDDEVYRLYGLTEERLNYAKSDAIVMHPGPTNRGVEIASEVADGPRSVILEQVSNGLAVRMALMSICLGKQPGGHA